MVISNESNEHAPQKRRKAAHAKKKSGKPGRPGTYTEEIGDKIVEMMTKDRMSVCRIGKEIGIANQTIFQWALDPKHPFYGKYVCARQIRAEAMLDEILEIADQSDLDCNEEGWNHEHIARQKLRVDTRKWAMSKVLPKVYGDTGHGVSINNTVIAQTIQRTEDEQDKFLERKERIRERLGIDA